MSNLVPIAVGCVIVPVGLWFIVNGARRARRHFDDRSTLVATFGIAQVSVGLSLIGGYAMACLTFAGIVSST